MEIEESWTYNDFLTYLLLIGANADLKVSEDEKNQIVLKVGEDNYDRIKRVFDRQSDSQRIETVSDLYGKYEIQIGGKENLAKALTEIFVIDNGKITVMDRYTLIMLKKIL